MKRPDITPAQIVALVQAVIAVLVSFSVPISDVQSAGLLALTTIVASVLIVGDAAIRRGRAKIVEADVFNSKELERMTIAFEATQAELEELRKKSAA
jgi:hypothetical protein